MSPPETIVPPAKAVGRIGWALLGSLLAAIFVGSVFYDRSDWPGHLAGEATYLMQARSLAEDFDLAYTRSDFDRMLLSDLGNPTDLSLVSINGGQRITFDRPFPYAVYLAPFVKIWPRQGFAMANALLLILASVFAAKTLERFAGSWSALWVALLIFGSVLFVYVFLATGDLFLFVVTLVAFCLMARGQPEFSEKGEAVPEGKDRASKGQPAAQGGSRRWMLAGALLAIPAASESLYTILPAAAFFVPPPKERGIARAALVLGFLLGMILLLVGGWFAGGGPELLGASQFRFTPETGYPLVDFTAAEWPRTVRRLSALHWDEAPRFAWGVDVRLWAWDGFYLLFGRSIGLLPYFAPLLLLLFTGSAAGFRRPIAYAALLWGLGTVILHPFNLYGGEGAIANRWFLPIYGALWMLIAAPAQQGKRWARPVTAVALFVLAAPFLWRLWASPWSYPIEPGGGARHVTKVAAAILPYEVSQRWLQDRQPDDHNGLMIEFLTDHGWAEAQRGRLMIDGTEPVGLLIASIEPIDTFRLDFGRDAPSTIRFAGGELLENHLKPGGGISFRVAARSRGRHHPMWWSPEPHWLYLLSVELPETTEGALGFALFGERFEDA